MDDSDDDFELGGCGYSYDHSLEEAVCIDGLCSTTCRECGAELTWEEINE